MSSKARIYLYKEGNECTSITGGYIDSYSNTGTKTVTKGTNSFKMINTSDNIANGGLYTNNKIDLSIASKLIYDMKILSGTVASGSTGGAIGTSSKADQSTSYFIDYINIAETSGSHSLEIIPTQAGHVFVRLGGATGCRLNAEVHNIYLDTKENVISINSQNTSSINFSCNNLDNLIIITKAEVYINTILSKSYTSNFDNLTYDIDNSLISIGDNKISIKVTYTQGDEIFETVEEVLNHTYTVNNLYTSSSLKELIDRQELLTNVIEIQKNTLKSILENKNVEVSEEENKLSILINKVNQLGRIPQKLYLYKDGDECINTTGGFDSYEKYLTTVFTKNTDHLYANTYYISTDNAATQAISCINKITFNGKYSKLKIDCEVNCSRYTDGIGLFIGLGSGRAWGNFNDITGTKVNGTTTFKGEFSLDISNILSTCYVNFMIRGNGGNTNFKIYKIWLEE